MSAGVCAPRTWLVAIALLACGTRTPLEIDRFSSPDAAVRDAAVRDGDAPRDATPTPDDAGVDDGGTATCAIEGPFEIVAVPGRLSYPALARVGSRGMLAFTRDAGDASEIVILPIRPLGDPRGMPRDLARGMGGTLVGTALGDVEPGFTLSFRDADGQLAGARFGLGGEAPAVAPLGRESDSPRPLLVLTRELAANAWNALGSPTAQGFVERVDGTSFTEISFPGRDPVGARADRPDWFRSVTHDGSIGFELTMDAGGELIAPRTLAVPTTEPFPLAVTGVRIVDGALDAWVLYGGVIRALEQSVVHLSLGEHALTHAPVGDFVFDVGAAYDEESGWLGVAAGQLHDEGISRAATPHVFFYGLARDGRSALSIVAGPLFTAMPFDTPIRPAIATTGDGSATFLVVWERNEGDLGRIEGARIRCP